MKEYVVGFLFNEDKTQVALIQKIKPEWQKGKLNGIGGKIEEGETPILAMNREFKEEAGLDGLEWKYFTSIEGENLNYDKRDTQGFKVHFFHAHSDKIIGVESITEERIYVLGLELIRSADIWGLNVIPNIRWLIPMALSMNSDSATSFRVIENS